MEGVARSLLEKLLADGEKAGVGRRVRPAALTRSNLADYHSCKTLQAKQQFEAFMMAARAAGGIIFSMGNRGPEEGFISRIELADIRALANFLGKVPSNVLVERARTMFASHIDRYPVLVEVLTQWESLHPVRTYTAEDAQDWLDAIRVIEFAEENQSPDSVSVPINEASGKLFKDTKRIKKLAAPIDVLLAGSIHSEIRPASEVWAEIGLFREEHPVRMAGMVMVERERGASYLDSPYIGLPAATVIRLASRPKLVLTIENQTTFHCEARRRCNDDVLLIYTAGMPNPPWREMYVRLLRSVPNDVPVYHWGDIDEGGFRIASVLAREAAGAGHAIKAWAAMHPDNVPVEHRRQASEATIGKMVHFAESAGWMDLAKAIAMAGFTVEQESLA